MKVLDFGPAKAIEVAPGSTNALSPTLTSPALVTDVGVLLGSVHAP